MKRKLVNNHFDGCVADRTAKIVISLDVDFDFLTHAKSFLSAVLLGSFHLNFELGQLVFFEPKEFCSPDVLRATLRPELNRVFSERELFTQLERSPGTAERIQCDFALTDFRAARIVNQILDDLICRCGIDSAIRLPRDEFPLHRFLWTIRRTIGECVDAPAVVLRSAVSVTAGKCLTIVDCSRRKEVARPRPAA